MGHLGGEDFENRHGVIKSQQDLIQKGLFGGLPEEDLFKAQGEGSRGGKIIGHTKSGRPIYDAESNNKHVNFSKEDHKDAKQAHIDKIDEHHNAYWKAKSDAKRKEHEDATNYHRKQAMFHHNSAAEYDKNVLGKTKSGKEVKKKHHPRDYEDFSGDDHRDAAKLHNEKEGGDKYLAGIHEQNAKHKDSQDAEKNDKLHNFKEVIRASSSFKDAYDRARKIKDVPVDVANHFSEKYNPDDNLSMEQSFKKLYDEVKGGSDKKEEKESSDLDVKVKDEIRPYKGDDSAKWVRVTHNTKDGKTLTSGQAIDLHGSKEKAIEHAKKVIKNELEKDKGDLKKSFESLGVLESDDIQKSGEGSKGGKVIGHTKSGKPIYESFDHESHKDFSAKEHDEAYQKQMGLMDKHKTNPNTKHIALAHFKEGEKHSKEAWKKDPKGDFMDHYENKSKVEFKSNGSDKNPHGLGGTHNKHMAVKDGKVLHLLGEDKPYQPIGGKKALQNILDTTKEGETYEWKDQVKKSEDNSLEKAFEVLGL